ncbi:hypothetical protein [Achromobacter piechaudii]|uniref:hypothetical protein n=1 Tax=Achromobacter piechaudii TaxID=72556 RepID=UPI00158285BB|nr:hypothetical protein [Achromobacter piechaudii]
MKQQEAVGGASRSRLFTSSAVKVAAAVVIITLALATLGKLIEEWPAVLWLISLGGRFWGAVLVGLLCGAGVAWAVLVCRGITERDEPEMARVSARKAVILRWLGVTQIAGATLFIVANFALYASYNSFTSLNIHQQIAVVVMHAAIPMAIIILGSLAIVKEETC